MCVRMHLCARWINAINRELDLSAIGTTFFSTQDLEPEEEEREENAFIQNNCLWVINIWKEAYSLANPCTCFQLFIHILGGGKGVMEVGVDRGGRVVGYLEPWKEKWFFSLSNTTRGPLGICYQTWWDENGVKPKSGLWVDDEWTIKWNQSGLEFQSYMIIGYTLTRACRPPERTRHWSDRVGRRRAKRMGKTRGRGYNWPQDTRNNKDKEKRTGWNKVFTGICQGGAFLCSTMPQAGDWWEGLQARTISAPSRTSLDVAEETRGRRRSGNPVRDQREREDWEWSSERLNRRKVTVPDATN